MQGKICTRCHSGLLADHPEYQFWRKCHVCGYSEILPEEDIPKEHKDRYKSNKHTKKPI